MVKVVRSKRNVKLLFKIGLYLIKVIPMLIALTYLLNTILSYFNIKADILRYLGGISILPLILLYVLSFILNFCSYHRIFLHYIVITDIINVIDLYYRLPIQDISFLMLHFIITGLALFTILYLYKHVKNNKRITIKNNL